MKSLPNQKVKANIKVTGREEGNPPSNNVIGTIRPDPNATQSDDPTVSRSRASLGNMGDYLADSELGTEIDPGRPEHTGVLTARKGKAMNKKVTIETEHADNDLQPNPKGSKHRQEDGGVQGEGRGEMTPGEDYSPSSKEDGHEAEGPKGPYGSQVVRRLHADMAGLLHEYDEFLENLEDEATRQIVLKQIHHFIDSLEELEDHANNHPRYGELFKNEPLEGTKQWEPQLGNPNEMSDPALQGQEISPEEAVEGMTDVPMGEPTDPREAMEGMNVRPEEDEEDMYHKHVKSLREKHKQYSALEEKEREYAKHGKRGKKQYPALEEKERKYAEHGKRSKAYYWRKHLEFLGSKSDPASKKMRADLIKMLIKAAKEGKDKETLLQGPDKKHKPGHEACEGSAMDITPGKKGTKAQPSDKISPKKADEMLKNPPGGRELSEKQRRMLEAAKHKND